MRRSELLGIQWNSINWQAHTVSIAMTKNECPSPQGLCHYLKGPTGDAVAWKRHSDEDYVIRLVGRGDERIFYVYHTARQAIDTNIE
jgi:hypothetical protein